MNMIEIIKKRQEEIKTEILKTIENESFSLTQKNLIMQPLVDENKVLIEALDKLQKIKETNYFGLCNAK